MVVEQPSLLLHRDLTSRALVGLPRQGRPPTHVWMMSACVGLCGLGSSASVLGLTRPLGERTQDALAMWRRAWREPKALLQAVRGPIEEGP